MQKIFLILLVLFLTSCKSAEIDKPESDSGISVFQPSGNVVEFQKTKFVPASNHVLLIVGQDLGAVGGISGYGGYVEGVGIVPGGVTTYTPLPGLNGLKNLVNWGSGDVSAQKIVESETFRNSVLAIGLYMVDKAGIIAAGKADASIEELGHWIQSLGNRPVFLRVGYEFEGSWNHYNPADYIGAFRRIKDKFKDLGVTNCAFVWQSAGIDQGATGNLMQYYPGDDYVDWCAYSYFQPSPAGMLSIARAHHKPVMIAEATPNRFDVASMDGNSAWNGWYSGLIRHIYENSDVIKALAYINVDWKNQPQWSNDPFFRTCDSRRRRPGRPSTRRSTRTLFVPPSRWDAE